MDDERRSNDDVGGGTREEEEIVVDEARLDEDGEDEEIMDDDNFYKELSDVSDSEDAVDGELDDLVDEDLETTMKLVEQKQREEEERQELENLRNSGEKSPKPKLVKKPEVLDDFIRNFLVKNKMDVTLKAFQDEWFDKKQLGELNNVGIVPDAYLQNRELEDEITLLKAELKSANEIAKKVMSTWGKLKKERDYHKMHHRRVVQEKNKLARDLERMKKHIHKYDPLVAELTKKYQSATRSKMLVKLETDKLHATIKAQDAQIRELESSIHGDAPKEHKSSTLKRRVNTETRIPVEDRLNPYHNMTLSKININEYSLQEAFEGHSMSVTSMALHPKKSVVCTVSDDMTWRLWALPSGKLIMSGDGHSDWLSGCDFHPAGTHLATSSGDGTVKLWDFVSTRCAATFTDHTLGVWDVAFHDTGDFLVSASMDNTTKMWDLHTHKCRTTFRGHVDSVNSVCFQPYTNIICTSAGDKTISLWDIRTGLCIQSFYGHTNSCNDASFNLRGDTIASTDADGNVIVWDVRMVSERMRMYAGPHPAHKATFDPSGTSIAVASDDHTIKIFSILPGKGDSERFVGELTGHMDSVQAVLFDIQGRYMLSSGSDAKWCLWKQ